MEKTTLVIMAAGIGSRFGGGIKQLTSFGPNGEIIMDYSIYDALQAGFDKVVFVIRKDLEEDFKAIIGNRIAGKVEVSYAFQEVDELPEGFAPVKERTKPWGTGQAILACKDIVHEPFAVINADDYYGREAFRLIHDYLIGWYKQDASANACANASAIACENVSANASKKQQIGMAGFILKNTLSSFGGVTRGICSVDEHQLLTGIRETKNIIKTEDGAAVADENGKIVETLDPDGLVSMNFWGFTPEMFTVLEKGFAEFLRDLTQENRLKAEYLLPTIVDSLLTQGKADVTVLESTDHWFGVTFREDVPEVKEQISKLIEDGVYPEHL